MSQLPPGMPRRKRTASDASLPSGGAPAPEATATGSGDVEHANSDLDLAPNTRYTHGQPRNYKRCWFCLHAADPALTAANPDSGGLCDGYERDILTLVQTFWDERALTVDVDELASMALELFQKRAEAFAEDESAEVSPSDVTAEMIHDHYGGFHAAGSQALKASLKLAASYHMEILRQSKRNLFEAGKHGKKTVVAASAKLIGECTKHLIHLDEHWRRAER